MNSWGLLVLLWLDFISDEFMMNCLGHFWKSVLGLGFVEINEFLRKYVEIVRNCWICWVSVISDEFSVVSDEFLINLLGALMNFWVSDEFLGTSYCFIMIGVISLMGFWFCFALMNFRGFLMSFWWVFGCFCWVYLRWWVSDEFLVSFWWVLMSFLDFRYFSSAQLSSAKVRWAGLSHYY